MSTLFDWQAERDAALATVEKNAGEQFMENATAHILDDLAKHGPRSGEILTDRCKLDGIVPPNGDKAFGAVLGSLSRQQKIEKAGYGLRRKGHGTSGAIIWRLKQS